MNYYPDITYFVLNSEEKLSLKDIKDYLSKEFSDLSDYDDSGCFSGVKYKSYSESNMLLLEL